MTSLTPAPDGATDGSTPVLVGVGQFSERLDDPAYAALPPVEVAARAAAAALADAGAEGGAAALAAVVDTVAATRQFDESVPVTSPPLGGSDNLPRSVARRVGADPERAVYEVSGGQSPQHLVTELAADIAAGRSRAALVVGAEAISTVLDLAGRDDKPDLTETVGGQLDDRGYGLGQGIVSRYQVAHGLTEATTQYALFENARRARLGLTRAELDASMGELFAPFTEVAARNPHSAVPVARSADELTTVTDDNRLIADPFPKLVVSREKVNQGAAVVLTSEAVATELGIPRSQWVYLRGHADVREQVLMERPDLGASPASVRAIETALGMAGVGLDDLATLDLYSCFPIAVQVVREPLGLAVDDPRGLTLTGGLPFFGGAGNNYSMHAIAETVVRARATPGSWGLVGANGGTLSKYSAGVYSTDPGPWVAGRDARLQAELDAVPRVEVAVEADGWATVETWTVKLSRGGRRTAVVIGRLDDGRRFLANDLADDDDVADLLMGEDGPGARVFVRHVGEGNRVTLDEERMDRLAPVAPVGFRDSYEHVLVRRDGHVLEVTINRPRSRNALTPEANQELSDVFDAYAADRDLWVAILTGAPGEDGKGGFCSGNDLKYTASGRSLWMPRTGFAGLTSRRGLTKPVIAAVDGAAFGGGFEIALACHLVVAGEGAQFALPEVKVGLVAAAGGLVRLPRVVPPNVAREMILTGRRMGVEEAQRWGIVNRVAPDGAVLEAARELAAELMTGSPTAVRTSLAMMEDAAGHADPVDALEAPAPGLDELLVARDTLEGIMAFALKTEPRWRNL